jgi:hypothetical protein
MVALLAGGCGGKALSASLPPVGLKSVVPSPKGYAPNPAALGSPPPGVQTLSDIAPVGPENRDALKRDGWRSGVVAFWVANFGGVDVEGVQSNTDEIKIAVNEFGSPQKADPFKGKWQASIR